MLPKHGKINCRTCFQTLEQNVVEPHVDWRMINDPGAWGGGLNPEYLVLGFSKGATQAGFYDNGTFENVAFAGMRPRLTLALQAMGVLTETETVDEKISNPDSNIAFGSLIRCSVSRFDKKASKAKNSKVYACTGPLITKSFSEIPNVIAKCTENFLTDLPQSIRVVFLLSNTDSYVSSCQDLLKRKFPNSFSKINAMCVRADNRIWVHLAHASGLNGHFNTWLKSNSGSGLKRLQAQEGVKKA